MKSSRSNSDAEKNKPAQMSSSMANAIKKNHIGAVKALIALHHKNLQYLNAINEHGESVASWAISNRHLDIVKDLIAIPGVIFNSGELMSWLIAHEKAATVVEFINHDSVDVNAKRGSQPVIFMAIDKGDLDILQALVMRSGIDLTALDPKDNILTEAVRANKGNVLAFLLDNTKVDVNFPNATKMTALHCAVAGNKMNAVTKLLGRPGINVIAKDENGDTPLSLACHAGNTAMVTAFLEKAKDTFKPRDEPVVKALLQAASQKHLDIVKLFITSGLSAGVDLFSWAVENKYTDIIELLILHKDSVNFTSANTNGEAPLETACNAGQEKIVETILQESGNILTPDNETVVKALLSAVNKNHYNIVKLFIKNGLASGVDLLTWAFDNRHNDIVDLLLKQQDFNPYTVIAGGDNYVIWAIKNNHDTILDRLMKLPAFEKNAKIQLERILIVATTCHKFALVKRLKARFGIDANAVVESGDSALHFAAQNGDAEAMTEVLRLSGVKVNPRNAADETPLHQAAKNGRTNIVTQLLTLSDIDINARDAKGYTPFHVSVINSKREVFQELYKFASTDINIPDFSGITPLMSAVIRQDIPVIKTMLGNRRCQLSLRDNLGKTALMYAAVAGSEDIVEMLLNFDNSIVNIADNNGNTALHHAAKSHDNVAIVKKLLVHGANKSLANLDRETAADIARNEEHQCVGPYLKTEAVLYPKTTREVAPEFSSPAPSAPPLRASTQASAPSLFDLEAGETGQSPVYYENSGYKF